MHNFYYRQYTAGFIKLGMYVFLRIVGAPGGCFFLLWLWGILEGFLIRHENINVPLKTEKTSVLTKVIMNTANFPGDVVFEVVKEVMERGADINKCGKDGLYPLHMLAYNTGALPGVVCVKILHHFIENRCDVTVRTKTDTTVLQIVLSNLFEHPSNVVVNMVRELIESVKNNPDARHEVLYHIEGEHALAPLWMVLSNAGQLSSDARADIVELLLRAGADANERGREGLTPLQFLYLGKSQLSRSATEKIERMLLAAGGDRSLCDQDGNTCLHMAARSGQSGLCASLLRDGVDRTIKNKHGKVAADVAKNQLILDMLTAA